MDLKILRMQKRMTQWGLCKLTGISQSKISLFENGYVEPTADEKTKIAKALGVDIESIGWNAR